MNRNCLNVETIDGVPYMPCPHRTWWNFDGVHCHRLNRFVNWHPRRNAYLPDDGTEPTTDFPAGCPHHVREECVSTEALARRPHGETEKADADFLNEALHRQPEAKGGI